MRYASCLRQPAAARSCSTTCARPKGDPGHRGGSGCRRRRPHRGAGSESRKASARFRFSCSRPIATMRRHRVSSWPCPAPPATGASRASTRKAWPPSGGSTSIELGGVSVEMILAASGGIPQRAHTMLLEWARDEASRRLAEAADYASAGRNDLRAAEAALVDHVTDIQSLAEQARLLGGADDGPAPGVCPFKGLASFEPADAHYFHGRERLVAELVARLVGSSLLGVVGPSGSGKSSVVRAGLLSAVAGGVLPGSHRWPRGSAPAGRAPAHLAPRCRVGGAAAVRSQRPTAALDSLPGGSPVPRGRSVRGDVHLCQDEEERAQFIAALTSRGARRPRAGGDRPRDSRGLLRALRRISRPRRPARGQPRPRGTHAGRRASPRHRAPRQRVGLVVEPPLVDALVAGVEVSPGGCRSSRRPCSSSGSAATARRCASPTTRRWAASRGRSRVWRRTRTAG